MVKFIRPLVVSLLLAGLAGVNPGAAQQDPVAQCRPIPDSLERLTCYDGIPLQGGASKLSSGEFRVLSLDDFKVDQASLDGELVELQGNLTLFGEMLMLQDGQMDMSPILVEFSELPRDQRLRIVQRCGMGCQATVKGKVEDVMFQTGIIASSILVQ